MTESGVRAEIEFGYQRSSTKSRPLQPTVLKPVEERLDGSLEGFSYPKRTLGVSQSSPWSFGTWIDLFDQASTGTRLDSRGCLIFQGLFWSASSVSLAIMLETFYPACESLAIVAGRILTGVALSIILHRIYITARLQRMAGWKRFVLIAGLNGVATLVGALVIIGLISVGWPELPSHSPFLSVAVSRVISLTAWNLAYFGILLLKEYHAVKLEASEARLAVRAGELAQLRSQINPHFLLNSLNSVVAEKEDPGKVESLVLSLAGYLRFSLQQGSDLAPLGHELDALEDYLKVEKIRFEEKFEFEVEADSAARDHKVPNALVLPLVENAIKYGRLTCEWPLRLRIDARVGSGSLDIEVSNSGRWVDPGDSSGSGIGLSNLRKRLELLYAGNATLRIVAEDSLVCVRLSLPIDFYPLPP